MGMRKEEEKKRKKFGNPTRRLRNFVDCDINIYKDRRNQNGKNGSRDDRKLDQRT